MKATSCWRCILEFSCFVFISALGRSTDAASFLIVPQSFLKTTREHIQKFMVLGFDYVVLGDTVNIHWVEIFINFECG